MEPTQRLSSIDAWWNREFPPHSTRRLMFLLAAFPIVGLVPFFGMRLAGVRVPFALYLISTVAGAVVLALTWTSGSLRPAVHAGERSDAGERSGADGFAFAAKSAPAGPYQPSVHDFVVALPFAFGSVMVTLWAVSSLAEAVRPDSILMGLLAAAALAGAVVLRYSVWGLLLISAVGGVAIGLLIHMMQLIWQGDSSLLIAWGLGTAFIATCGYPMWSGLRARHARRVTEGTYREIPIWVLMSSVLVLSTSSALVFRFVLD